MREAAELAWQRPSGLGVEGGGTRAAGMWAWARAGKWLAPLWGTCSRALQKLLGWHRVSVDNEETRGLVSSHPNLGERGREQAPLGGAQLPIPYTAGRKESKRRPRNREGHSSVGLRAHPSTFSLLTAARKEGTGQKGTFLAICP